MESSNADQVTDPPDSTDMIESHLASLQISSSACNADQSDREEPDSSNQASTPLRTSIVAVKRKTCEPQSSEDDEESSEDDEDGEDCSEDYSYIRMAKRIRFQLNSICSDSFNYHHCPYHGRMSDGWSEPFVANADSTENSQNAILMDESDDCSCEEGHNGEEGEVEFDESDSEVESDSGQSSETGPSDDDGDDEEAEEGKQVVYELVQKVVQIEEILDESNESDDSDDEERDEEETALSTKETTANNNAPSNPFFILKANGGKHQKLLQSIREEREPPSNKDQVKDLVQELDRMQIDQEK